MIRVSWRSARLVLKLPSYPFNTQMVEEITVRKLIVLVVVALMFAGVSVSTAQDAPKQTIAEIAAGNADFSTLMAAVGAANPAYAAALSNKDLTFTVFAPTNAAFEKLLAALNTTAEDLLKNKALLDVVLAYHVVPGSLASAQVAAMNEAWIGTLLGDQGSAESGAPIGALQIKVADGKVMINDATVTAVDVMAVNGVIHVIDTVLVPADAAKLAEKMGMMAEATPEAGAAVPVSIAETVIAATKGSPAEFTTLLAAVQAANPMVVKELSTNGPYTVFAPTDAAFGAALTALNIKAEDLLKDQANLTGILAYHVVPGTFKAATIVKAAEKGAIKLGTLAGATLEVMLKDGKVMVNTATVAAPDVAVSNGVVHVIDAVLLPPAQ